jgi:peptidyl-prolyl cis-trans isomerase SurA
MNQQGSVLRDLTVRISIASIFAAASTLLTSQSVLAQQTASTAPAGRPVARIVASVDGEPITQRDVELFASAMSQPVSTDPSDERFKAVLKGVITQKLLESEVQQYSDRIEESHVDRYIEELRNDKHLTDSQLRAELQRSGMNYEDFRRQARYELEKMMMLDQEVRQKVSVPPEDIKAYYESHPEEFTIKDERYRIAQVLIVIPANPTDEQRATARAKAEAVHKRAESGADFAELARRFSDDSSRRSGGDLGWFKPDDIMEEILAAVKPLKPGEVSNVVETKHGLHVLKLQAHELPGLKPLDEGVSESIRNRLIDQAAQQRYQTWVEQELIKNHYVETFY